MNWYKISQQKVLYILRGLPGSGKSTKAKELGRGGIVLGADDFWGDNYDFDIDRLAEAHQWNVGRAKSYMDKGVSPIVIDNTNVEAWEPKPYVEYGKSNGYEVLIAESEAPWRHDVDELTRRNVHDVPRDVIQDKMNKWHHNMTVDDIMNSKKPEDI